jgi:hypothetical protein
MENAAPLFALAAALFGVGFIVRTLGSVWLRTKELDRSAGPTADPALLASIEERLARIEHAVDATAIEVERLSEAQRFAARRLAAGASASATE